VGVERKAWLNARLHPLVFLQVRSKADRVAKPPLALGTDDRLLHCYPLSNAIEDGMSNLIIRLGCGFQETVMIVLNCFMPVKKNPHAL